jgi:hypothetical protein
MRSYQFIMDRKNWVMNLIYGGLCLIVAGFIPVLPQMVLEGWLFEVIDSLHRDPEHQEYADFDFNRFSKYLGRGVWPVLLKFLVGLVIVMPIVLLCFVIMFGLLMAFNGSVPALIAGVLTILVLALAAGLLEAVIVWPATLYVGLSGEFNISAIAAFVKDFVKRVKKELFLSILFFLGTGFVVETLGSCAFLVGVYFAMAAVLMAQHHLMFQLYELYLERGGEPIPSKSEYEPRGDDLVSAGPH